MEPAHVVLKGVNETYPIKLTYKAPDIDAGETIQTVEVLSSYPSGGNHLTVTSPTGSGADAIVTLSKGERGTNYRVQLKVTTSGGNVYARPDLEGILVKVF